MLEQIVERAQLMHPKNKDAIRAYWEVERGHLMPVYLAAAKSNPVLKYCVEGISTMRHPLTELSALRMMDVALAAYALKLAALKTAASFFPIVFQHESILEELREMRGDMKGLLSLYRKNFVRTAHAVRGVAAEHSLSFDDAARDRYDDVVRRIYPTRDDAEQNVKAAFAVRTQMYGAARKIYLKAAQAALSKERIARLRQIPSPEDIGMLHERLWKHYEGYFDRIYAPSSSSTPISL